MDRRALLTTGATAAGAMLAAEASDAQNTAPAAGVADRTSSIRLTKLTALPTLPKAFLKLETNHGITGWGEISNVDSKVACALAESLFELLNGENPTRIEYLWQKVYRSHRNLRGGGFMVHTLSAIDMALWDIAGKLWGVPVYRLLGGPCRDKIRMYPSRRAVKVPPRGLYPYSGDPPDLRRMADQVKRGREQVGPDGAVMFDAHSAVPPATLIQFAAMIEPYDLLFLEEPWVPGNIEVAKKIRQQVRVPLATGERDRTIWGILPYLQEQCVDIIQPDVGHTGGISQMKKIAALGEAYYTPIAPHCTASYLGLTASLHVAASVAMFLIHEGGTGNQMPGVARRSWNVDAEGYANLPEGPGLGVEIDEPMLVKLVANPERKFSWPVNKLPDGSISDY